MGAGGFYFKDWWEYVVSQERGNRLVRYYLTDVNRGSILAVVGTERSVRHMFYVVSQEFLQACGDEGSVHAGFKWRSRREVIDWLNSMLSKPPLHLPDSESPSHDSTQVSNHLESPENDFSPQDHLSRDLDGPTQDIVWNGAARICGKQLKHYSAFCRGGTIITVYSFAHVMAKEEAHYVAYLEDMYEDKKGQKKVKVRWFHHNQEIKGTSMTNLKSTHPKEIFMTPYSQVISPECIDGPATVLTREHYTDYLSTSANAAFSQAYICFRQFKGYKLTPFDLSSLHGYHTQPLFSTMSPKLSLDKDNSGCFPSEEGESSPSSFGHPGSSGYLSGMKRGREEKCSDSSTLAHESEVGDAGHSQTASPISSNMSNGECASAKKLVLPKRVGFKHWGDTPFHHDDQIELLCQDSGLRGCWFRCTVINMCRDRVKVLYNDIFEEDGDGNLKEWVIAFRHATPDKLGVRVSGRPTIRPMTSTGFYSDRQLVLGSLVDAWWSDGWWEGIVTGVDDGGTSLQVYFPGENFFLFLPKEDLRISRDWTGDGWVGIRARPDVALATCAGLEAQTETPATETSDDVKLSSSSVVENDDEILIGRDATCAEDDQCGDFSSESASGGGSIDSDSAMDGSSVKDGRYGGGDCISESGGIVCDGTGQEHVLGLTEVGVRGGADGLGG